MVDIVECIIRLYLSIRENMILTSFEVSLKRFQRPLYNPLSEWGAWVRWRAEVLPLHTAFGWVSVKSSPDRVDFYWIPAKISHRLLCLLVELIRLEILRTGHSRTPLFLYNLHSFRGGAFSLSRLIRREVENFYTRKLRRIDARCQHAAMPKFVPRQRKHKVLARQKLNTDNGLDVNNGAAGGEAQDANALEILPAQQREREERKQKIKDELVEQQRGKMSGKRKCNGVVSTDSYHGEAAVFNSVYTNLDGGGGVWSVCLSVWSAITHSLHVYRYGIRLSIYTRLGYSIVVPFLCACAAQR